MGKAAGGYPIPPDPADFQFYGDVAVPDDSKWMQPVILYDDCEYCGRVKAVNDRCTGCGA